MLKRFSSTFRKEKDRTEKDGSTAAPAASNGALKASNGTAPEKATRRKSSFGISKAIKSDGHNEGYRGPAPADHGVGSHDVASVFKQYAQVIHAAQRPLPNQTGDGSYIVDKMPSGLFADLKSVGFKDVATLMDVMKNKASGELQDDKTYVMERVIQVSRNCFVREMPATTAYLSDLGAL